jgi:hypothetical protein
MKKIAFCFLIYDQIENEELWQAFFSLADKDKFNIYIHFKVNKHLYFLEEYKLPSDICVVTKYADVSLIHAQNAMFRYAFEHDSENYKFVLLSGSCIPLKRFQTIYDKLSNTTKGFLNICPPKQCFPNCNSLLEYFPREYIGKASQWIILNRTLIEKTVYIKPETIQSIFQPIYAPEEIYYHTMIKLNQLENEIDTTSNLAECATTFTNWEGMDYKYVSKRGIKTYQEISMEEMVHLLYSPCLFGRKFVRNCKIELADIPIYTFILPFLQ